MTDIPEDVMKSAREALCEPGTDVLRGGVVECAARAILAEREAQRERDAKIADGHKKVRTTLSGPEAGKLIAQSIAFDIRHP